MSDLLARTANLGPPSVSPRRPLAGRRIAGPAVAALVLLAGVVFAAVAGVRPAYDPYGWLTWGHQAWHLALNTDAAPSWKPLTFLFTLPYALLGHGAVALWMATAAAGALAAPVLAAVVAWQLSGRGAAAAVASAIAALAVLDIAGFWHGVLTATADAPIAAGCLGAVACHLAGRRRAAFALLCLAALGRPEAAPFALAYGAWLARTTPQRRGLVVVGLVAVSALWIGVPAITSRSPFSAGTTALAASAPTHGSPIVAAVRNYLALEPWVIHLAAAVAVLLGAARRDRTVLYLGAAAGVWVVLWCGLALAGWEPDGRYMLAPAAIEAVLAGLAVGAALRIRPRPVLRRGIAIAGAAAVCVALVPVTAHAGRTFSNGVALGRNWADQLGRLQSAIRASGGPARVLGCGEPVTVVTYQSVLAYDLGTNVSAIGWQPGPAIASGRPMVLFLPYVAGWHIRPIHTASADVRRCRGLRVTTEFAYSAAFRDFLKRDGLLGPDGRACGLAGTPPCRRRRR